MLNTTQLLNENLNLMRYAKGIDEKLARGKNAIAQLQRLIPYYEKGLVRLNPAPQELALRIHMARRNIVDQYMQQLYSMAEQKVEEAGQQEKSQSHQLSQVYDALERYKEQMGKQNEIRWRKKLESGKSVLLVKDAQKDEKKGQSQNAIDHYLEALDMLRADDTGAPEQQTKIDEVKRRIRDLGGTIPESWEDSATGDSLPSE